MDSENVEGRLAEILSADVVGYSRLMAEDEEATIRAITARREEVELHVRQHRGRLNDFTGDNFLAEFGSVVQALECAVEIQRLVAALNADLPPERKMEFRIGLHLGEVRVQDDRLFGTGVYVAARLESLAEPGGICISGEVHGQVESRLDLGFVDLGEQSVKNIPKPVRVFGVRLDDRPAQAAPRSGRPTPILAAAGVIVVAAIAFGWWLSRGPPAIAPSTPIRSIAVLPFDDMSPRGDQEYFADGISEEITNALTGVAGLRVVARTSGTPPAEHPGGRGTPAPAWGCS